MTDDQEALLNKATDALVLSTGLHQTLNRVITSLSTELQRSWDRERVANELVRVTRESFDAPRLERMDAVWEKMVQHVRDSLEDAVQSYGGSSTSAQVFKNLLPMIDMWNDYIEGGDPSVESASVGPT